jgi:colanic acid/amylovoran biosynthesis glycosyltransferase
MRILHSVGIYLSLSENWIYPQITRVPEVSSRVLCNSVANRETFPIEEPKLYIDPPPWEKAYGIPRLCNALARRVGWGTAFLRARIGWWKPQILHAHFGMRGWESLALKKRLRCRLITSFYGCDAWTIPQQEPIWKDRYRELFLCGELFFVEGPAMRNRLTELGCPVEKVLIQRIGVDLHELPFVKPDFSGGLKVAMAGRFIEKKGMIDGLCACALACVKGVNLQITIIGDASANDAKGQQIKAKLVSLAERPELRGRVQFTGFIPRPQLHAMLRSCNVFLSPSRHAADGDAEGGSPVVLTEAMALGLLCIGTRHCDIPEIIVEGQTGYLSAEGDSAALAEILRTLAGNPSAAIPLVEAARRHIEASFSLQQQMRQLHAHYLIATTPGMRTENESALVP